MASNAGTLLALTRNRNIGLGLATVGALLIGFSIMTLIAAVNGNRELGIAGASITLIGAIAVIAVGSGIAYRARLRLLGLTPGLGSPLTVNVV